MTISCNQDPIKSVDEPENTVSYTLTKYTEAQKDAWDDLVAKSVNGTLLHTRKFLSYHGNKFADQSVLAYDETNTLRAVFPAASDPDDETIVISHPGITYGGIVHEGWVRGHRAIDLLQQLTKLYANAKFKELIYKAVPWIYHRTPAQDDIYALSYLKANRYRVDLSTTVDLRNRGPISERRKRLLKKAGSSGLQISHNFENIRDYWSILSDNLKDKHDKKPVHSVEDLRLLKNKFPDQIELITAVSNKQVMAGSLIFHCPTLIHAQYFASSPMGRTIGALDLVIENCLEKAKQLNKSYFDFGISTEDQGTYLNDGLHTFKSEFGGGGTVYEFYKLEIK